jgi:hypothetical protein
VNLTFYNSPVTTCSTHFNKRALLFFIYTFHIILRINNVDLSKNINRFVFVYVPYEVGIEF